jgi:hypothetical protein
MMVIAHQRRVLSPQRAVPQPGGDMTVVAARYGGWYARLVRQPGKETREGSDVARMVVGVRHNNCPVIVDVGGGWGAAAVGALETAYRWWPSTGSIRPR